MTIKSTELEKRLKALAKRKCISDEQLLEQLIQSEEEALAWLEKEKDNAWRENSSDRTPWLFDLRDMTSFKVMGGKTNPAIDKRYKI